MSVARKDEPIQGPRTVEELEEAIQETLELLYTGRENVAKQAMRLCLPMERLKALFNQYVADRPIDVTDCLCYNLEVKQAPPTEHAGKFCKTAGRPSRTAGGVGQTTQGADSRTCS